jgi:hypothetical protein
MEVKGSQERDEEQNYCSFRLHPEKPRSQIITFKQMQKRKRPLRFSLQKTGNYKISWGMCMHFHVKKGWGEGDCAFPQVELV